MFTYKTIAPIVLVSLAGTGTVMAQDEDYGLGREATDQEIAGWDIDVPPSGEGLPDGSGSVADGKEVYQAQCQSCHGADGKSGPMDRLAGGNGTLASDSPVKTVGSYWPYATTLYDYVYRAMPFNSPQSLSPDETYAVTAYVLHLNGIVEEDATLDSDSLPEVKMPNRDGFAHPDPRPDVDARACMSDCRSGE
ncbi:cytochrome c [Marinobacter sp. SS8-8]|uniref:c-type cytochrome n=1 Tax=Marinobacter sp. SS8-8 TaxID=3050452 RepID=UPI000C373DC1|nr:cytochrome c [Marinobacter sp. SS8-8]MAZ05167.1 cytochrome C [Halomonas sp.]